MSINIGPPSVEELRPRITVIGVGGAGGNAIANMIEAEIEGVDFIVANTDAQALNNAVAETRIQLGPEITQGLGAGSRPEVGRAAAEETVEEIERSLDGVNMVFIAAGMGGGTGTGAAAVIAEAARRKGVLTVGVVTKPFLFEGTRRMRAAEAGIEELQKHVDTLIVIPNQNLFLVAKAETTFKEAFQLADEVLQQGVRSITDLMVMPGLINLDFADVRSVMQEMGKAMMGTGEGEGENRALEAAERAIANPLLDGVSMQGAKGVIISIIGGDDMKLLEVDEAANHIRELVDDDANIIWGSAFNPDLEGRIRVSVVATGIEHAGEHVDADDRPLSLTASRGPKRPALPIPSEEEMADMANEDSEVDEPDAPKPFDLADEAAQGEPVLSDDIAAQAGDETDEGADEESSFGDDDWTGAASDDPGDQPLDLSEEVEAQEHVAEESATEAEDDSLLLDASRLAEADDNAAENPGGRRRKLVVGEEGEGLGPSGEGAADAMVPEASEGADCAAQSAGTGSDSGNSGSGGAATGAGAAAAAGGGSTLFERMANLSRGARDESDEHEGGDEDEDEDGDGSGLSIPRFLGRQNNQ